MCQLQGCALRKVGYKYLIGLPTSMKHIRQHSHTFLGNSSINVRSCVERDPKYKYEVDFNTF